MKNTRMLYTALVTSLVLALAVQAAEPPTALGGNCPVCLVNMNKLVEGDAKFASVYDGKTYLFPSNKQKAMFDADPTKFVPALGGDCSVCLVEMGKRVAGKAEFFSVHDDRLFLFPSAKQKKMFDADPHKYTDADLALGGACAVCLVKLDKVVAGKAEHAVDYDGKRYLFPSDKQKQIFVKNPTAFAPALGGNCTVCKVEKSEDVEGKADFHLTHNDRLYLFPSQKQLDMFKKYPSKYADSDIALGGNCTVCKVEMSKDVAGKQEFAIDYRGKRYLFPGTKQRDMFIANPTKYVIN